MDFLKNISREDAALIERIAPFVVSGVVFRSQDEESLGDLRFAEIMELQEIGILSGVEAIGMQSEYSSATTDKFVQTLTSYGRLILVTHADAQRKFSMSIYGVTKIGREVLNLGWKKANEEYLHAKAMQIKKMGFDVEIGDYRRIDNNSIMPSNMIKV